MIHNPIPGAAVVSHKQFINCIVGAGHLALANLFSRLEKAPQHVHGSFLGLKWTPTATTKSEKNCFYYMMCILLFSYLSLFFKTGTRFFPSYIRKQVFVMLLVVLWFHCVVILERTCPLNLLVSLEQKQTRLMSCVEKVLFPQAGWLPRVLKVSTTLQRRTSATLLHALLVKCLWMMH